MVKLFPSFIQFEKVKNVDYKRRLKNLWKIFLQYCDYTSIGGFRFFTPLTPRRIRIPATILFACCICMVTYQILYTLTSYSGNINVQYSTLVNSHFTPLPYIFICKPFGNETKYPYWEECQNPETLIPQKIITRCYIRMNGIKIPCAYHCVWTAQGFCLAVTPNTTAEISIFDKNSLDQNQVETYKVILYIPEAVSASGVTPYEVYLEPYDDTHTKHWSDTHAFSVRPSVAQLYPRAKTHIYIDEHYQLIVTNPRKRGFEHCIWDESLKVINETNCNCTKFAPYKRPTTNFTVVKPLCPDDCVAGTLRGANEVCVPNKELYECYISSMSVFENFEPPDFHNDGSIFGNLEVAMHTTRSRVMYSTIKPQAWKLASDIGGTLSLYTGFTLMGIIETIFFLSSPNLRNLAAEDEQTAVERKNPPMMNPLEKPVVKKIRAKSKVTVTKVKAKASQRLKPIMTAAKEIVMKILGPAITYVKNNKYVMLVVNKSVKFVKLVKAKMAQLVKFAKPKLVKLVYFVKTRLIKVAKLAKSTLIKFVILVRDSKIVKLIRESRLVKFIKNSKFVKLVKKLCQKVPVATLIAKIRHHLASIKTRILKLGQKVHPKKDLELTIPTDKK